MIDGKFSHCGIDSIDVVKVDGTWKIANFMWTVEKSQCPTDPSAILVVVANLVVDLLQAMLDPRVRLE